MKSSYRKIVQHLVTIFALAALSVVPALAQVTTADITGRVLDQLGAAVPNATVTARNEAVSLTRTTTTNEDGEYSLTQLPPGAYEFTVEKENFSRAVVKAFELNVGARPTLNFDLRPGDVSATIEVTADAVLVETTRSDISGTVTPTEIQNLPLLGRTLTGLAIIVPEARPSGNFDPTKTRIGNFAMNGGDGRQLDVNVDGGSNKDNVVGSLVQNFSYESIREFQVNQHRWTAEQGRSVGGIVNVITKSGSNELHGSGFGQFRDEAFRRLDFFEERQQSLLTTGTFEKPTFSRQEFGGSVGGPIVRDKLFFFGAFERFRERSNNFTPADRAAQLAAIPGAEPAAEIPLPYNDTLFTIKADHNISDRQTMFYRYAQQNQDSRNDQIAVPANADLSNGNTNTTRSYNFVVNHTATFSPTKLNVFTFHYLDFKNQILGVGDRQYLQFPTVVTGNNVNVPQETIKKKFQLRDDFSIQAGAHSVKFGGDYINTDLGGFFNFGASGYQVIFFNDPIAISTNRIPDPANPGQTIAGPYTQGFATPGAVRNINFFAGETSSEQLAQRIHQLAFYVQDDYRVSPRLTLNLGLRWDANIGNLPDQTNNRTIRLLQQLNHPRARAITGDPDKLSRTTPSYTEFQPRLGFAFDPRGDGRTVIRGGYGIFYDQIFQNLTLFSLQQTRDLIYQQVLGLTNTAVGVGQLATFRFGVDPLPPVPPGFSASELSFGSFGRINDPDARDPYVQKFSIGVQTELGNNFVLSSDFTHTLGLHEPRVQVINPFIRETCDASFPGSTPTSPLCVRGANTRLFDRAFVDAGFPITSGRARLEQINMIGTTNRSLYDSWTTTIRRRTARTLLSASYVLSSSRAWGGQPLASYAGNAIQVTPENQFKPEEFGPTRIDERHRIVASGVVDLPGGVQFAPILQFATARPYSLNTGFDLDGDNLAVIDRLCEGVDERAAFNARGNLAALQALNPPGCRQIQVNSRRGGFITDPRTGEIIEDGSGRFFNVDLRATKVFRFNERVALKGYADIFNLFDTRNLSFGQRQGLSTATSRNDFIQPTSLFGPGFGPPVGRPLTLQLGLRVDF